MYVILKGKWFERKLTLVNVLAHRPDDMYHSSALRVRQEAQSEQSWLPCQSSVNELSVPGGSDSWL